jgi:hypothetical protein
VARRHQWRALDAQRDAARRLNRDIASVRAYRPIMATDLMLPAGLAPSNLHLRSSVTARLVENDVFDIAKRASAIDPRLHIWELSEDDEHAYVVMEHGEDGVERLIFRVSELDARVLERLRYIMAVPLSERFAALEKDELRHAEQRKQDELDELYENLGGQMRHDLARCGFTGPLPMSAPLRNPTAMRHRHNGRH